MALRQVVTIFIDLIICTYCLAITNDPLPHLSSNRKLLPEQRCSARLESALNTISTRRSGISGGSSALDLEGYALHHPLRNAPYEMYVTDMRIKAPGKWARVDKCRYDDSVGTLQARLVFRDLAVFGNVKIYDKASLLSSNPMDSCNMTLRMRRAGVGFTVMPVKRDARIIAPMPVNTAATFVEPQFISVHAYGCKGNLPTDLDASVRRSDGPEAREATSTDDEEIVSQEIEQVFLRGVRSLLTKYLESRLEPALRDTLMMNLGYSISYGKR
ncbi:hypothetical protein O3M35_011669 [Rhynocoris fuscipes]|uniref:Secreted protein n=1 Tax=Rhynocoris fuscipes TaxID=488301 RepID=A0AAW1D390_9HEMI